MGNQIRSGGLHRLISQNSVPTDEFYYSKKQFIDMKEEIENQVKKKKLDIALVLQ